MWSRQRNPEAAKRVADRRQREQDAPRLLQETPGLQSLYIELKESGDANGNPVSSHIRRFQLSTAPALFLFPCGDPKCDGGGHDITDEVLAGLREHKTRIEGQDACVGAAGEVPCTRTLSYAVVATFE
ncbi:MAG: hypothetical protein HY898_01465 [Deltaproteobacteria bacterium]|nr:hypothetical protein [Deltaproteobacteria bacterium]